MAHIEHDQLDALLVKLENTCEENSFTYKFLRDSYPVRIVIAPDGSMDGQISMLDNPVGYNSQGCSLSFVFQDGDVYFKPGKDGGLSMNKRLQNKLRTLAEKIHAKWMQVFFIDSIEARSLAGDDTHAHDPEFEPIGDGEVLSGEDPEIDEIGTPVDAQAATADNRACGDNE